MMIIPPNYGQTNPTVRKGLGIALFDTVAKVHSTVETFEDQAKELERTQKQVQFLTAIATILVLMGGTYGSYRFIKYLKGK